MKARTEYLKDALEGAQLANRKIAELHDDERRHIISLCFNSTGISLVVASGALPLWWMLAPIFGIVFILWARREYKRLRELWLTVRQRYLEHADKLKSATF